MATNKVYERGVSLRLPVASTVKSGDPVVVGTIAGVAITDYAAADACATVDQEGVYALSVKGIDGSGNSAVAIGDLLFFVEGDTPAISKKTSGVAFGIALQAVTSGATATIQVQLKR